MVVMVPLLIDYYAAVIMSSSDYYAFGSPMAGRSYSSSSYRYGMNTQEKVEELGSGHYTALFWEFDSRTGRRWNIDPIMKSWESPYATFSNNPIVNNDPNGDTDGNP